MSFNLNSRATGNLVRDPRLLPRSAIPSTPGSIRTWNAATVLDNSTDFFTAASGSIDRMGPSAYLAATGWSAGVSQTVVNVTSGGGILTQVFGPETNSSGTVTTFVITVDGIVYTFTGKGTAARQRICLGGYLMENFYTGGSASAGKILNMSTFLATSADGRTVSLDATQGRRLLFSPHEALSMGMMGVVFDTSLKVEIRLDINSNNGAAYTYAAALIS